MASVQELKDALIVEQGKSAQLADRALQAVDTVTNQANFWLAVLSFAIALVGLIGLAAIYIGTKREARRVAEGRIKTYLDGAEGKALIRTSIEEEVRSQIEGRAFLVVKPQAPDDGGNGFPLDPQAQKREQ